MRLFCRLLVLVGALGIVVAVPAGAAPDTAALQGLKERLRQRVHPAAGPRTRQFKAQDGLPAGSGPYHNGSYLHCSDCHIMHASKDGVGFNGSASSPAGYSGLLRAATSLEVCLTCHDGVSGIPDVVGADTNGMTDRAGGAFAAAGTVNPNGHNLGPAATDLCVRCHFGGDMQTAEVTCVDCHDPHGNGRSRNLQWASWPEGTPPLGLFVDPNASGTTRYEASHVAYGTDGTDNLREVTNICVDCHHVLSGAYYTDPNGNGHYEKHPVSETERGAVVPVSLGDAGGATDSAHWVAGSGAGFDVPRVRFLVNPATNYSSATAVSSQSNVFCLTCHRAHGSANGSSIVWPGNGDGSVGPSGCDQCHKKSA